MTRTVAGIYEHGVIRPLSKLPLAEHQKIEIRVEIPKTATQITRAIIRIKDKVGKALAESIAFNPLNN
jgi:predicted DNA-binding antitoxin AbrB/MazE fold protein